MKILLAVLLTLGFPSPSATTAVVASNRRAETPAQVAKSLMDADRAYAAAASKTDMMTALGAMMADGVMMPTPGGTFATGKSAVLSAIQATPDASTSRVAWTPIRVGISADGEHGFSFGYMTQFKPDSSRVALKYMAYWVREQGTWRVIGYKRARSAGPATDTTPMPASLPVALTKATRDPSIITSFRHDVMKAEHSFSAESQQIGVGNAFARFGSRDAVNMGGPALATFVVGADSIAKRVSGGDMTSSTLTWGADTAFVASSGDLGITFGVIHLKNPPAGAPPAGISFFTIWRRADVRSPWRYIAE